MGGRRGQGLFVFEKKRLIACIKNSKDKKGHKITPFIFKFKKRTVKADNFE